MGGAILEPPETEWNYKRKHEWKCRIPTTGPVQGIVSLENKIDKSAEAAKLAHEMKGG